MQHLSKQLSLIGLTLLGLSLNAFADTKEDINRSEYPIKTNITGTNITGPNDLCGDIVYTFPQPFPDIRLSFMGELNTSEGATDVIPLTADNCVPETVLATTTDPVFLALNQGEDTDTRLKNLPLRDVPVYVDRTGLRTLIERNSDSVNPYPVRYVGDTSEDITLGQWLSAKGTMDIVCHSNSSSTINASLTKLIPDSLYTIWGWYKAIPPGATEPTFVVLPLGGVPNTVITNKKGKSSKFNRSLSYCPTNITEDGSELLAVVVTWHPDGAVYGATPSIDFVRGNYLDTNGQTIETTFPVGIVGQDQVIFPVRLMETN